MARLGDFCKIKSGYAFKSECFSDVGVPVIRIGNITSNGINIDYSICYDVSFWNDNPNYRVEKNEILVAMSGATVGKACINTLDMPLLLNQRVASIVCNNLVTQKYVYHIINSDKFLEYVIENSAGCAQPNISAKQLSNFQLIVPEIKIQKQIVTALDVLCNTIVLRKQQLAKLDELVKSRFVELFGDTVANPYGWKKDMLGIVCDVRDGTHDSPQYFKTGYPLVTSKNVTGGKIDLTDCSLISEEDFMKINERSKVDFGDILMPMIGTVGKPVIVNIEPCFAIKNVSLIKFNQKSQVLNIYIKALLQSDYFDDVVLSKVRGGTQKFISLGDIRKLDILVPPLELQNQFATFVEQTDKSKFEIQKSLQQLETLKKALMQKYFG